MQRVRSILAGVILVFMCAWFFGGSFVLFPDSPIEKCDSNADYYYKVHPDGYCGKQGQDHTEADFRRFNIWEHTLLVVWPLGIGLVWLLQRRPPRRDPGPGRA